MPFTGTSYTNNRCTRAIVLIGTHCSCIEPDLIPALRKYGMSFYAYSPLGGGFFTMAYRSTSDQVEAGTRFDPNKELGQFHRSRYWNETYFTALKLIETAAKKHDLNLREVALRWISHHSQLKREFGDSVIIGVSSPKHIESNLNDCEKGPLREFLFGVLT